MRIRLIPTLLLGLAAWSAAPTLARAQATPQNARRLEQEIQAGLTALIGPAVMLPPRPVELTAQGDHYDLAVPLAGSGALRLTAKASQGQDGVWTLEDPAWASPATAVLPILDQPRLKLTISQQSGQITYDPSFASASVADTAVHGADLVTRSEYNDVLLHVDRGENHTVLGPDVGGRVEVSRQAVLVGLRLIHHDHGSRHWEGLLASRLRLSLQLTGVSRARTQELVQGVAATASSAERPSTETLEALFDALADEVLAPSVELGVEDLDVLVDGENYGLRKGKLAVAFDARGGSLKAELGLQAEGPRAINGGDDPLLLMLPEKIAVQATASGLADAAAAQFFKDWFMGERASPENVAALFSPGIKLDVQAASVELFGATIAASGSDMMTGPDRYDGSFRVTATNLDLLLRQMSSDPDLSGNVSSLLLLMGLGRVEGGQLVWDVRARNQRVLVNGQDLFALAARLQR